MTKENENMRRLRVATILLATLLALYLTPLLVMAQDLSRPQCLGTVEAGPLISGWGRDHGYYTTMWLIKDAQNNALVFDLKTSYVAPGGWKDKQKTVKLIKTPREGEQFCVLDSKEVVYISTSFGGFPGD